MYVQYMKITVKSIFLKGGDMEFLCCFKPKTTSLKCIEVVK